MVTPEMEGQKVCVYGIVYSKYNTNEAATFIKFTPKANTFFLYDKNNVYENLQSENCVVAIEVVQLFNHNIPCMSISNLYKCESWMR